jgi:hypothetical protein
VGVGILNKIREKRGDRSMVDTFHFLMINVMMLSSQRERQMHGNDSALYLLATQQGGKIYLNMIKLKNDFYYHSYWLVSLATLVIAILFC